jgi:EAL domain-containing protein (putative c-di-GMP-specific phosphodiesterase class I)
MKILVIDDEPFVLKVMVQQLGNLGFGEVRSCGKASEAMEWLAAKADGFDVVICDLRMPEIDGVEFVRHLAAIGYGGGLILTSGEDGRILQAVETLANAQMLNVLGILHKPAKPEQLQALLSKELRRAVRERPAAGPEYGPEELERALREGELRCHYQPKVALATGAVKGVEALVRWCHPRDGLIYPDRFIATAEQHGLIDQLTRTVLATAARQAQSWLEEGLSLTVAVNVSMDNLATLDFPDYVEREMRKAKLPPTGLMLELTESRLMKDRVAPLDILTRLRLKHIGLSIDDFGTGHSSLAQLRDIPFDELKVDRGFVHGAWRNPLLRAIFDASLAMARQLQMNTVAEGVEDQADWDFLRSSDCHMAQGYFIARPMPAEEIPRWIKSWEQRRPGLVGGVAATGRRQRG